MDAVLYSLPFGSCEIQCILTKPLHQRFLIAIIRAAVLINDNPEANFDKTVASILSGMKTI